MFTIKPLNEIAEAGLATLPQSDFKIEKASDNPEGIIVRSFNMHQMELPNELLGIARAGAGTNNIPIPRCTELGIPVFNAPGGNANAVKEMVLTALFLASRGVIPAYNWVQTLTDSKDLDADVEAGKKNFIGPELKGKKLGVVGLGAIGVLVANSALDLGMEVIGFDPFLSLESAWHLSSAVVRAESVEDVVSQCDYITLHIPLTEDTKHMYNDTLFQKTKKGARLMNFARGTLVDNQALLRAINNGTITKYISDFPESELLGHENIILMPHLGASTPESEENCAVMATISLREYLQHGNIKNSVNFPNCIVPFNGKPRVTVAHENTVNMIGQLAGTFANHSINIDKMVNNSKNNLAYTMFICDTLEDSDKLFQELQAIDGVLKVRFL